MLHVTRSWVIISHPWKKAAWFDASAKQKYHNLKGFHIYAEDWSYSSIPLRKGTIGAGFCVVYVVYTTRKRHVLWE